jgi:hypothetical protein
MLNEQEQERFVRLWAESQQAVVNYICATCHNAWGIAPIPEVDQENVRRTNL